MTPLLGRMKTGGYNSLQVLMNERIQKQISHASHRFSQNEYIPKKKRIKMSSKHAKTFNKKKEIICIRNFFAQQTRKKNSL